MKGSPLLFFSESISSLTEGSEWRNNTHQLFVVALLVELNPSNINDSAVIEVANYTDRSL